MALYYVTGQAGTGKSTVCHELCGRGFYAVDSDEGYARWVNKQTGYIHPKSSVKPAARTNSFLAEHDWKIPRSAVVALAEEAVAKPVVLCGVGGNEHELRDLFKAMFALVIDDVTMKHRLMTRSDNNWGKQQHELDLTLSWQAAALQTYRQYGHIMIDATMPLDSVVTTITEHITQFESPSP